MLRILHLSDLHLGGVTPLHADEKVDVQGLAAFSSPKPMQVLERTIKRACGTTEAHWPKAIIVTGDLVNSGGSKLRNANNNEFDVAAKFSSELAHDLNIKDKRVFVVPGNHDVTWDPKMSHLDRFDNFMQATTRFSRPTVINKTLTAFRSIDLTGIVEGVDLELLLLVSPTFSGADNPEPRRIARRIRELLCDLEESELDRIQALIDQGTGALDIAAIGQQQREMIADHDTSIASRRPIRVAALHHHLLPDPSIEITSFEAVLDAGLVLEQLIDHDFDLVLSGHKHSRRLVTYRHKGRLLDIFNGPSVKEQGSHQPAFTIIDFFDARSPHYAELRTFATADGNPVGPSDLLYREGRVMPDVEEVCAKVPPDMQQRFVLPALRSLHQTLSWRADSRKNEQNAFHEQLNEMLYSLLDRNQKRLQLLAKKTLEFSGTDIDRDWQQIVGLAETSTSKSLRLVSDGDLDFWRESRQEYTEAYKYCAPLRAFSGKKSRILILSKDKLRHSEFVAQAEEAIGIMIDDGFDVEVVFKSEVPGGVRRDFGIIGDFAVSEFLNMGVVGEPRTLKESFGEEELERGRSDWSSLKARIVFKAGEQPLGQWFTARFNGQRSER